jgi:hypothetical protein
MSYDTRYTLTAEPGPGHGAIASVDIRAVVSHIPDNWWRGCNCEGNTAVSDRMSWYKHEEHMRDVSKMFPYLLFTLRGEGQQNDDMWAKYFLKGKMQEAKAVITFAPFDIKELK